MTLLRKVIYSSLHTTPWSKETLNLQMRVLTIKPQTSRHRPKLDYRHVATAQEPNHPQKSLNLFSSTYFSWFLCLNATPIIRNSAPHVTTLLKPYIPPTCTATMYSRTTYDRKHHPLLPYLSGSQVWAISLFTTHGKRQRCLMVSHILEVLRIEMLLSVVVVREEWSRCWPV